MRTLDGSTITTTTMTDRRVGGRRPDSDEGRWRMVIFAVQGVIRDQWSAIVYLEGNDRDGDGVL
jgi:hypothetical protein